jgi:hypothetical protein
MPPVSRLQLNFRAAVIMLMTLVVVAFSSAETRAAVMVKMAEEQGVARFYEDKVVHHSVEVVRLAQMQTTKSPEEIPSLDAGRVPVSILKPLTRRRSAASPRAPPHCPRAPPAVA